MAAAATDKLLELIKSTGVGQKDQEDLRATLTKQQKAIQRAAFALNSDVLLKLEPSRHTLGMIFLMSAQLEVKTKYDFDEDIFAALAPRVITEGDPFQQKAVLKKFVGVCAHYSLLSRQSGRSTSALRPLRQALHVAASGPNSLTPLHAEYIQHCILARQYRLAETTLDKMILQADVRETGVTALDVLRYFYYGGIVYTGLNRFQDAINSYHMCMSVPARALSGPAIEAYKKLVLLSLILHGKVEQLPKSVPSIVRNHVHKLAQPYVAIRQAFGSLDSAALAEVASSEKPTFKSDKNWGLVQMVMRAMTRRRIQRLTHVYLTLSLDEVAAHAGLADGAAAERELFAMVENGQIDVSIDQSKRMVVFKEHAERFDDPETVERLEKSIRAAADVLERLRAADGEISRSVPYLQKTLEDRDSGGAGAGASSSAAPGFIGH